LDCELSFLRVVFQLVLDYPILCHDLRRLSLNSLVGDFPRAISGTKVSIPVASWSYSNAWKFSAQDCSRAGLDGRDIRII
jgi:hypothetical protein